MNVYDMGVTVYRPGTWCGEKRSYEVHSPVPVSDDMRDGLIRRGVAEHLRVAAKHVFVTRLKRRP